MFNFIELIFHFAIVALARALYSYTNELYFSFGLVATHNICAHAHTHTHTME